MTKDNGSKGSTMSDQDIHEFGINVVYKYAKENGYEIINGTNDIDQSPQLILGKENQLYFVIVKTTASDGSYKTYGPEIMKKIKQHAVQHHAKVLYAGVGVRCMIHGNQLYKNSPFMVDFRGFEEM